MKKVFIFSFLLLGIFCFSQSVTKRYNSMYQRYEYFNSSGNMIGYERYNSLYKRWEYFDTQQQNPQARQPTQYRDPAKGDLGIDTYNRQSGNNQNNVREHRDSNGNLIGVEMYNPRTREWEYYDAKPVK